jgi:hypothetical protein
MVTCLWALPLARTGSSDLEQGLWGKQHPPQGRDLSLSLLALPWQYTAIQMDKWGRDIPLLSFPLSNSIPLLSCALLPWVQRTSSTWTHQVSHPKQSSQRAEQRWALQATPLPGLSGSQGSHGQLRISSLSWGPSQRRQGVTVFWSQPLPCFSSESKKNLALVTHKV